MTEATTTWSDTIAASTEAQKQETKTETVTDVIDVPVTDTILARIARDNAADDLAKRALDSELDALKEKVKVTKAKVDEIESRMSERHSAVRTGVLPLEGEWTMVTIFATNTVRYIDPSSGEVMLERPLSADERQMEMDFDNVGQSLAADAASILDESDDDPDEIPLPEFGEAETVTDPDALLKAAEAGDAAEGGAVVPIRRRRAGGRGR